MCALISFPGRFVEWLDSRLGCAGPLERNRTRIQHFGHCAPIDVSAKAVNKGVREYPHTGQFMLPPSSFAAEPAEPYKNLHRDSCV